VISEPHRLSPIRGDHDNARGTLHRLRATRRKATPGHADSPESPFFY
jgi:hypothetical protein